MIAIPITKTNESAYTKPKRVIYAGCIDVKDLGRVDVLDFDLYGNSPNGYAKDKSDSNVWTTEKYEAGMNEYRRNKSRYLRVSTNEKSMVRGTVYDSIKEVGIYPVEIVLEFTNGNAQRFVVEGA